MRAGARCTHAHALLLRLLLLGEDLRDGAVLSRDVVQDSDQVVDEASNDCPDEAQNLHHLARF